MIDKKIVNEWLSKAKEDIGFASMNLAQSQERVGSSTICVERCMSKNGARPQ